MSLFTDSSLCLVPSGVKDGKLYSVKPTDGSGDLTFSRGSDIEATRVAANGYIEKAKVNLVLQSNQFDTSWLSSGTTETGGQAGYDGTNDAWLLQRSDGLARFVYQFNAHTGVGTFSVYIKKGNVDWVLLSNGAGENRYFDLTNGVLGATGTAIDSKIESVGGGWFRCSIAVANSSEVRIYPAVGNGTVSGLVGANIYIQDAQLNYGLVAQEYQETTTTSVITGITNDMPRLDYSGGASCPSLLLEPQRTNLMPNSEYMGDYGTEGVVTIEHNSAMSPEGVQNATNLIADATNSRHHLYYSGLSISGYATSVIYAKPNGHDYLAMSFINGSNSQGCGVIVDLTDGSVFSDFKNAEASFTINVSDAANGFKRVEFAVYTFGSGLNFFSWGSSTSTFGWNAFTKMPSFTGDNTSGILIYGAQVEMGVTYPTSYIPTYGTSATRTSESCYKTGVSSLIGSSAGTMYLEVAALADDLSERRFALSNGTNSNVARVGFTGVSNRIIAVLYNGANQCILTYNGADITQTNKIAFTWSVNDFALFVNGVKRSSDASGTTFAANTLTRFGFDAGDGAGSETYGKFDQVLLFKSRLSDSDLATLTTL